jgi:hypothetical protein
MSLGEQVRLHGGPAHGRLVPATKASVIELPQPSPYLTWAIPVKRKRKGKALKGKALRKALKARREQAMAALTVRVLRYRYLATADDGTRIYACDPWAIPPWELGMDLWSWLVQHHAAAPPAVRAGPLEWVMGTEWARELVRQLAGIADPEPEDVAKVDGGQVMGLPCRIAEGGGVPHLERIWNR